MEENESERVAVERVEMVRGLEAIERARDTSSDYHPATFTAPDRATYLIEIESHGGLARAADVAGCSTTVARTYAARVPEFGAAVRDALTRYRDSLTAEATRRAVEGVAVDRFNRDGEPVGAVIQYSDGLLGKLLDRGDRIIGDLPQERGQGVGALDATMVSRLSPEGRSALRIVLSELAGLVPNESDLQKEGISSVIEAQP